MKVILHVHTSYSRDCLMSPARVVKVACDEGADLLLVSDHDSFDGARAARREVASRHAHLYVPIAAEILTEVGDVIVTFDDDPGDLNVSRFKRFARLVATTHSLGGLVILPHPYHGHPNLESFAPDVDVIEVFNARCTAEQNERAKTLASALGKTPAYAADAHLPAEMRIVSAEYDGLPAVATLRTTPRLSRGIQTFRFRIALASLTKAVRDRQAGAVLTHGASLVRNLVHEALIGQSRLQQ